MGAAGVGVGAGEGVGEGERERGSEKERGTTLESHGCPEVRRAHRQLAA